MDDFEDGYGNNLYLGQDNKPVVTRAAAALDASRHSGGSGRTIAASLRQLRATTARPSKSEAAGSESGATPAQTASLKCGISAQSSRKPAVAAAERWRRLT